MDSDCSVLVALRGCSVDGESRKGVEEMATWVKSSRCEQGNCVEVNVGDDMVLMRNTEAPCVAIVISVPEWVEFVAAAKRGEFDRAD